MVHLSPGKMSLRFTGGLLVSMVTLNMADLMGGAGLTANLNGNTNCDCRTLGAPVV